MAIDEITDVKGTAEIAIFIRCTDNEYNKI